MCGFNFTTTDQIKVMNGLLSHRGLPGRDGIKRMPAGDLGHVRLPIQGLGQEYDQPWIQGKWAIAFVGEIYNYKEIDPNAKSDIEVIAATWEAVGVSGFDRFDGMYSFAAYDALKDELYIVTDELSKKPVYFHAPTMSFSSEIKPLTIFSKTFNKYYFSCVGKWGYNAGPETPFNDIYKVPANHMVHVNLRTKDIQFHQRPTLQPKITNLKFAIEKAVRNRLVSDVPVSVLCSGGLDSSIILYEMLALTKDFTVYHIDNDESKYFEMLNIPIGVPIVELPAPSTEHLAPILYANDGPVDLGSMLPQYAMAKSIKDDGMNVVLTGDGADELFGGYRRSKVYDSQLSDIYQELIFYHLPRLDKLSMAHTVELRSPFLSKEIVQHSLSLPYKVRTQKEALQQLYAGLLPNEIVTRPKHPLKSKQVLSGESWRYQLIDRYKEMYS